MRHQLFLVEDHPVMCQAYAHALAHEPDLELCGTAASAEEALDALADTSCDLLLTDFALPGMNGAELVERLRTEQPELRSVVISGYEDESFIRRAREAGALAYLHKRDLGTTLVPTIRRLLASGPAPPFSPSPDAG